MLSEGRAVDRLVRATTSPLKGEPTGGARGQEIAQAESRFLRHFPLSCTVVVEEFRRAADRFKPTRISVLLSTTISLSIIGIPKHHSSRTSLFH